MDGRTFMIVVHHELFYISEIMIIVPRKVPCLLSLEVTIELQNYSEHDGHASLIYYQLGSSSHK